MNDTKKPPLKALIITIIWMMVFFLWVIITQEYTLYSWEEIYLETVPVDPRDLLRWDYVTLRYAFENDELVENYIIQNNIQDWTPLYISFRKDSENNGTVSSVGETKPGSWIFLQVQVKQQSWWRSGLETGIWKYFVPQWTGREIEKVWSDMKVLAKIDTYGTAKIVNLYYQWEIINPKTFRAP
jgi:uncharacterized membrane-anchored protein